MGRIFTEALRNPNFDIQKAENIQHILDGLSDRAIHIRRTIDSSTLSQTSRDDMVRSVRFIEELLAPLHVKMPGESGNSSADEHPILWSIAEGVFNTVIENIEKLEQQLGIQ